MIKKFNSLIVTMFGLGKVKIIPGTVGSFATIIILYILFHILNISSNLILLLLIIIFIYSFSAVASHIEDNDDKDPREIIIDEFIYDFDKGFVDSSITITQGFFRFIGSNKKKSFK